MNDLQKETLVNLIDCSNNFNRDELDEIKEILLDGILNNKLQEVLWSNGFNCYPLSSEDEFCALIHLLGVCDDFGISSLPLFIYSLHTKKDETEQDYDDEDSNLEPQFSHYYLITEPWNLEDIVDEDTIISEEQKETFKKETIEKLNFFENFLDEIKPAPVDFGRGRDRVNRSEEEKSPLERREEAKRKLQKDYLFRIPNNLKIF